jgi:integrase/recombinase XerC
MKWIVSFEKYLKYERRYSDHTVRSYMNDLEQFSVYLNAQLGMADELELKHFHVRSWIVHLMQDNYTAKTVNRKMSTLKSYFKYLKKSGHMQSNPTAKVIAPKIAKRLPVVIREERLEDLLDQPIDHDDFVGVRNHLVIELLYTTGIRRSELINLKDVDFNHALRQIKVLGKGNKERIIPISDKLIDKIRAYQELKKSEDLDACQYLIITVKGKQSYPKLIYTIVHRQLTLVSTAKKRSPHILRHSFATHLANQGAELNAIKEIMGHANLSATEIYMHNSIDRLRTVYKKAHPKSKK